MAAHQVTVRVDRSSPVPLYHQLAEQLRAAIDDGTLSPGDPFENEVSMAERLHLSRPTVRRAIQDLVDHGLVVRRRGIGTTIANRKVHRKVELTSLYDDLARDGRTPRTRVVAREITSNPAAAAALDLPRSSDLLSITRVRSAGDSALAVMQNWLPAEYADLTTEDLEREGLYALLRDRGVKPVVARQSIGARMPTPAERRLLGLKGAQPVLTMSRVAFDATGSAIEFGDHVYRAEDYLIEVMIDERGARGR